MIGHIIRYEKALGWVIESRKSDLKDRQAIVLESWDDVEAFCAEFEHAYTIACAFEDWES